MVFLFSVTALLTERAFRAFGFNDVVGGGPFDEFRLLDVIDGALFEYVAI